MAKPAKRKFVFAIEYDEEEWGEDAGSLGDELAYDMTTVGTEGIDSITFVGFLK